MNRARYKSVWKPSSQGAEPPAIKTPFPANSSSLETGFTQLDLLAIVGVLAIIAMAVAPALANNRSLSQQATCFDNLRQIGAAFLVWVGEHNDHMPARTPTAEGGTRYPNKVAQAWTEFFPIRDVLESPRVLACPADEKALSAPRWQGAGRSMQALQDFAVSYFVGLETDPSLPSTFLSGDHHMTTRGFGACSSGILNASIAADPPLQVPSWTNAIHGPTGNLLLNDGSVHQLSSRGLGEAALRLTSDDGILHILSPAR